MIVIKLLLNCNFFKASICGAAITKNLVPAATRSPAMTVWVALGFVIKIAVNMINDFT